MRKVKRLENVVLYDDKGMMSIMVKIPRPDTKEIPAVFKIGDRVASAIYISKYPNTIINGKALSLPFVTPATEVSYEEAIEACRGKGDGWHLMTAVEWEYIMNRCRFSGYMPYGNNNYGKDYFMPSSQGGVVEGSKGLTSTGTNSVMWTHDGTDYGICDLNGNVSEYVAGLRIKNGILEYIPNNNAAMRECDLSIDSNEWKQIKTSRGIAKAFVQPGKITISDLDREAEHNYEGVNISELDVDLAEIPQELRDLGIAPKNKIDREKNTKIWIDSSEGEYIPTRGSCYEDMEDSGASALSFSTPRDSKGTTIGFRASYYEFKDDDYIVAL